ncbi:MULTISPECIES: flagellar biosynthesis protein FlhA [Ramlibacter]|nr:MULTISPECIES: flagellar biosynthesis protein FlhA [Ramlibacter]
MALMPHPRALGAPALIVMVLAMMLVPLPPFALDLLFSFNIALALVVLIVSSYTQRTLEFASFPSVLLVTTLLRLSLNVASTRAVLLNGHTGTGAAGQVIESFAHFLIGGSFAVGIVVFAILTIINFVVITKGAGRIAEVSARFALDAMPGKQMAIDADLAAGSINEKQARQRRSEVTQEAEFYGSMDGASKFVRGDAIAGIMILFINVIGGLAIGMLQHNLPFGTAVENYTLLAIGDGLVAQVPALVISVAAGLIVSRVGEDDIGKQVAAQLFSIPRALGLTAGVLAVLGLVPGMPHIPFLVLAGACGWGAWALARIAARPKAADPTAAPPVPQANAEASWEDVTPVDTLGLEVGYRLIALVDKNQGGDLLARIKGVRKKFAGEVGFLPPAVHIRDNLELHPSAYRILLKGVVVGEGQAFSGMYMAINPGHIKVPLAGTATKDPAFGLDAVWIEARLREGAQAAGYTVVDAATVLATHLNHVMQSHAAELLGRGEVQELLDHTKKFAPALVDETVPKMVPLATLQKVLRNLLDETIHIRDLRGILELLAENAHVQDAEEMTRLVRVGLAPAIVQTLYGPVRELGILAVEPGLEQVLVQALAPQSPAPLDPAMGELLCEQAAQAAKAQEESGLPACLLVPDRIRSAMARLLRRKAPRLHVLAHSEIPRSHSIQIQRVIGVTP